MKNLFSLKNVGLKLNGTEILKNISVNIEKGDYIGIIGSNGSGKTTLLKLLLGFYELTSGKLVKKNGLKIGYVSQDFSSKNNFFPISVKEVLLMGITNPGFFTSKKYLNLIEKKLDEVGLDKNFISKNFHELSGGQKQKVVIARALISSPEILLLDEAFSNIDLESKKSLYSLLWDLNKTGVTIVFISHEAEFVTKYCKKIICLDHGKCSQNFGKNIGQDSDKDFGFKVVKHVIKENNCKLNIKK